MKRKEYLTSSIMLLSTIVGILVFGIGNIITNDHLSFSVVTGSQKIYNHKELGFRFDYKGYYLKDEEIDKIRFHNETTVIEIHYSKELLDLNQMSKSIDTTDMEYLEKSFLEVPLYSIRWRSSNNLHQIWDHTLILVIEKDKDRYYIITVQSMERIEAEDILKRFKFIE